MSTDSSHGNAKPLYCTWLRTAFASGLVLPVITLSCTFLGIASNQFGWPGAFSCLFVASSLIYLIWYFSSRFSKLPSFLDSHSLHQQNFFDNLPTRHLATGIFITAFLSLFLELVLIRWQACLFEFFAFYKNFSLLACFCGLGTGYAMSNRKLFPLLCTPLLIAWQIIVLLIVKYGLGGLLSCFLHAVPVTETWFMGLSKPQAAHYVAVYTMLAVTFILSALSLLPVGQLCGRLMARMQPLPSYSLNLLGSLTGIVLVTWVTFLWTPPAVWFGISFLLCLLCLGYSRSALIIGAACTTLGMIALNWPVAFGSQQIYSPYQLLELKPRAQRILSLRAAGTFYQDMLDLSKEAQKGWDDVPWRARYYELPYRLASSLDSVAIIGAGSGNDLAAALRCGAKHVDAVEIDPAIQAIGQLYHPELPYNDARVHATINDGRAFLRHTESKFDVIVFGLVDSHTLSSQATSLRLDSYIYTVEAIKEARAHLKDSGILSLAFCIPNMEVARKFYCTMRDAFDGHMPVVLEGKYENSVVFLQSKNGALTLPNIASRENLKDLTPAVSSSQASIDVSTDDWPFVYMVKRHFPFSYMLMVFMVLLLSYIFVTSLAEPPKHSTDFVFFLLGAGFMLLETKAITELGLHMGNTFQVIGAVIATIMLMAFLSNLLVQFTRIKNTTLPYIALIASLFLSWQLAGESVPGLPAAASAAVILTFPVMFSGIVFSLLLKQSPNIGAAMGMNIFGAMCGGLIEYCAMLTGYHMLYIAAIIIYAIAFTVTLLAPKANP